jgi:hypothetical protein
MDSQKKDKARPDKKQARQLLARIFQKTMRLTLGRNLHILAVIPT